MFQQLSADESARIVAASGKSDKAAQAETAYVATSRAVIYSGPSEEYYPTQILQQGTALEVYHQTDSGWLGIRPPGGSFSWVPANDAYLSPGGKSIEITSKNSVSWIGSSLGTAKQYRWQVRLNVGEQLSKLGEETIKDKDGKENLWYKIAPPNGEFRWIQSGAISRQPPAILTKQKAAGDSAVVPASSESVKSTNAAGSAKSGKKSKVKPANYAAAQDDGFVYEGEVIDGGYVEGEIIEGEVIVDGEIIDGGYIDGGYVDGEIIDGEVIYEDSMDGGQYISSGVVEPQHDANWNDWQLFEFTDQGLRLPFLERAAAWRSTQPDPLYADPFALNLAPKQTRQMRPGLPEPSAQISRRRTPWRDPRELSQQRMMGYPQASTVRGSGTTLSALRGTLNSPQGNATYGSSPQGVGGAGPAAGPGPGSGYGTPGFSQPMNGNSGGAIAPGEPHLAPQIDWSARSKSNIPSLQQNNLQQSSLQQNNLQQNNLQQNNQPGNQQGNPNFAMGQAAAMGRVDLPNLPQDPFASSTAGGGTGGSWTNRNWFGINQQNESNIANGSSGATNGGQGGPGFGMLAATGNAVQQLQQRLSEMVTRPMQQWNFGELKERVRYYINNGTSPTERGQARLLLERIDEFERHAMRSGYTLSSTGGSGVSTAPVITASYTTPVNPAVNPAAPAISGTMHNNNFDATGWLVPVHAAGPKQPTHALTSDSGQIVAYITALPGMSLESFVNQAVGIHGLRGYLPEFQAAHVEAQNITRLR